MPASSSGNMKYILSHVREILDYSLLALLYQHSLQAGSVDTCHGAKMGERQGNIDHTSFYSQGWTMQLTHPSSHTERQTWVFNKIDKDMTRSRVWLKFGIWRLGWRSEHLQPCCQNYGVRLSFCTWSEYRLLVLLFCLLTFSCHTRKRHVFCLPFRKLFIPHRNNATSGKVL